MRPEIFQAAYAGFSDATGNPLSAGKLYTYDAGTTTPRTTWANPSKTVTNANPVVLDASGRAEVWCDGNYKFDIRTSAEVPVDVVDNVFLGRDDGSSVFGGTSTGAANTYAVTLSPPLTEYQAGQIVKFAAHQANTSTSPTININGLGSRNLVLQGVGGVYPNGIVNGGTYAVLLTASDARLLNPHTSVQTYVPTVTFQGGGSGTLNTLQNASYIFVGPYVILDLLAFFTVNSGTVTAVRFTLPVTPVNLGAGGAFVSDGGVRAGCYYGAAGSTLEIARFDGAAFAVSSSRQVGCLAIFRWI